MNEIELIQFYCDGKLKGAELMDFEKRLEKETDFKQKVADYQLIFAGLQGIQHAGMQHKLKTWSKNLPRSAPSEEPNLPGSAGSSSITKIALGLGTLLILLIAYFYMGNPTTPNSKRLVGLYIPIHEVATRGTTTADNLAQAYSLYGKKDLQAAETTLLKIKATDQDYPEALYVLGDIYYNQEAFERSAVLLKQAVALAEQASGTRPVWLANAEWLRLLALSQSNSPLGKEQIIQELDAFAQGAGDDPFYTSKIKELKSFLQD